MEDLDDRTTGLRPDEFGLGARRRPGRGVRRGRTGPRRRPGYAAAGARQGGTVARAARCRAFGAEDDEAAAARRQASRARTADGGGA
ncbi:hypothetical protein PV342_24260, partial [Streptomyces sp. PA03-3a]|nr:hypothetical protein [Streptomyces sp. PA03-3a]